MGLTVVTSPTALPMTLAEQKTRMGIFSTDRDGDMTMALKAATAYVERQLNISLMQRTLKLSLDSFSDSIKLPQGPVTEVVSVNYIDANGATQTVATDVYSVDLNSREQWVVRNSAKSWPAHMSTVNAVSVTYKAGFLTLPDSLADLKAVIAWYAGYLFETRGTVPENETKVPWPVTALLDSHRAVMV